LNSRLGDGFLLEYHIDPSPYQRFVSRAAPEMRKGGGTASAEESLLISDMSNADADAASIVG
jgi:hypothetical protein